MNVAKITLTRGQAADVAALAFAAGTEEHHTSLRQMVINITEDFVSFGVTDGHLAVSRRGTIGEFPEVFGSGVFSVDAKKLSLILRNSLEQGLKRMMDALDDDLPDPRPDDDDDDDDDDDGFYDDAIDPDDYEPDHHTLAFGYSDYLEVNGVNVGLALYEPKYGSMDRIDAIVEPAMEKAGGFESEYEGVLPVFDMQLLKKLTMAVDADWMHHKTLRLHYLSMGKWAFVTPHSDSWKFAAVFMERQR